MYGRVYVSQQDGVSTVMALGPDSHGFTRCLALVVGDVIRYSGYWPGKPWIIAISSIQYGQWRLIG